jgi:hypothetical protein
VPNCVSFRSRRKGTFYAQNQEVSCLKVNFSLSNESVKEGEGRRKWVFYAQKVPFFRVFEVEKTGFFSKIRFLTHKNSEKMAFFDTFFHSYG